MHGCGLAALHRLGVAIWALHVHVLDVQPLLNEFFKSHWSSRKSLSAAIAKIFLNDVYEKTGE